eukprot:scaffold4850_cov213-Pinguiococcus_pyrenoidosus.AAC.27
MAAPRRGCADPSRTLACTPEESAPRWLGSSVRRRLSNSKKSSTPAFAVRTGRRSPTPTTFFSATSIELNGDVEIHKPTCCINVPVSVTVREDAAGADGTDSEVRGHGRHGGKAEDAYATVVG